MKSFFIAYKKTVLVLAVLVLIYVAYNEFHFFRRAISKSDSESGFVVPSGFNLKKDWRPELPQQVIKKINEKYDGSEKQRAMIQYATALWLTLNPNDEGNASLEKNERALNCTYYRGISPEEKRAFEAYLFKDKELLKQYLTWNSKLAGILIQGRDFSEADCD